MVVKGLFVELVHKIVVVFYYIIPIVCFFGKYILLFSSLVLL